MKLANQFVEAVIDAENYENLVEDYIESNPSDIYNKYCEINPEEITSDFELENLDGDTIYDFVINYMESEIEEFILNKEVKENEI